MDDGTRSILDLHESAQADIREAAWMELHGECEVCHVPLCFSGCCTSVRTFVGGARVVEGDVEVLERTGDTVCKVTARRPRPELVRR